MRRTEREITDREIIDRIIELCPVCRLGLYDGSTPYIVPVNFIYTEATVYFHSAGQGKKLECLRAGGRAAVEWDIPGNLITAEKPCDYGFDYVSVIAEGRPFFIESAEEKGSILTALTSRYSGSRGHSGSKVSVSPEAARGTVVLGIELDAVTGKASREEYLAAILAGGT